MSAAPPALAPDLADGLRRLKLAAMRQLAPELLRTAKTQRWTPEELLRTLVEAEIAARDASNARTRLKTAAFPVIKTLDEFDRSRVLDPAGDLRLPRLAWSGSPRRENLCLVGPAGTGKSHLLVALGVAAVDAGHRVRYFTAADLVETLYRGLADNSVGRVIDTLLRNDLIICRRARVRPARRHRRPTAVPVRRRRLRTPRPGHRLPLALRGLGPVPARTHHRRQPARPAPAPRQRRGHRRRVLPHARSPNRNGGTTKTADQPEGWGLLLGHQRGPQLGR